MKSKLQPPVSLKYALSIVSTSASSSAARDPPDVTDGAEALLRLMPFTRRSRSCGQTGAADFTSTRKTVQWTRERILEHAANEGTIPFPATGVRQFGSLKHFVSNARHYF